MASMSDTDTGAGAGAGEHALVKTEAALPAPPPGLIPIARDPAAAAATAASLSAEKQQVGHIYNGSYNIYNAIHDSQVQAAMAMAAFYSQNPLYQAMMARERLQQQQLGGAAAAAAAAAALSQLPGRPPVPGLGGLAGLLTTVTQQQAGGPGLGSLLSTAPAPAPDTRTDLFRDYLSKLAQSSLTSATSLPQYLASVSTSSLIKADDIKTENPLPASLRPGRTSTSSNRSVATGWLTRYHSNLPYAGAAPAQAAPVTKETSLAARVRASPASAPSPPTSTSSAASAPPPAPRPSSRAPPPAPRPAPTAAAATGRAGARKCSPAGFVTDHSGTNTSCRTTREPTQERNPSNAKNVIKDSPGITI